jgi:hypothetical protein
MLIGIPKPITFSFIGFMLVTSTAVVTRRLATTTMGRWIIVERVRLLSLLPLMVFDSTAVRCLWIDRVYSAFSRILSVSIARTVPAVPMMSLAIVLPLPALHTLHPSFLTARFLL